MWTQSLSSDTKCEVGRRFSFYKMVGSPEFQHILATRGSKWEKRGMESKRFRGLVQTLYRHNLKWIEPHFYVIFGNYYKIHQFNSFLVIIRPPIGQYKANTGQKQSLIWRFNWNCCTLPGKNPICSKPANYWSLSLTPVSRNMITSCAQTLTNT